MASNGWGRDGFGDSSFGRFNDRDTYHERPRGGGWGSSTVQLDSHKSGGGRNIGSYTNGTFNDSQQDNGWEGINDRSIGSRGHGRGSSYMADNEPGSWMNSGNRYDGRDLDAIMLDPEDYSDAVGFQKNLYTPHKNIRRRLDDIERYKYEKEITLEPLEGPPPAITFEEVGFPEYVMDSLIHAGFQEPTPIQAQAWPVALSGFDLIGLAETGSGKTIAYLLPGIVHIMNQRQLAQGDGPVVLIMAPTRELACQILEECQKFGNICGVKSSCVYGGAQKNPQMQELKLGVHVLVATPGRLIDMLECRATNLRRVTYLVLDEGDRMLDMGFEPQIRKIVQQIRPDRQTLLWSATWPKEVEEIASDFLIDPYKIIIGSKDLRANHNITQKFMIVKQYEKFDRLVELLSDMADGRRILIFCQTKRNVDEVTLMLRKEGWPALSIHGDKAQPEREWVLQEFKTGNSPIMLATDVAARGLDVKDVQSVVNYDMPNTGEDYVHRIGRTGRAGALGTAYSFFTEKDIRVVKPIIKVIEEAGQIAPYELHQLANSSEYSSFGPNRQFSSRGARRGGYGQLSGPNTVPVGRGGSGRISRGRTGDYSSFRFSP